MRCWFWNIDILTQKYFASELNAGRLRQGWGYDKSLDMRMLKERLACKEELKPEEKGAWARCSSMLEYIKPDDLIVVKNVPSPDKFTIVRVTGTYDFIPSGYSSEYSSSLGREDYAHVLPIQIVRVYNKYSIVVPSPFISALNRERNPIRITYKHHETVVLLSTIEISESIRLSAENFKQKIDSIRISLFPILKQKIRDKTTPTDFERLVVEMLKAEDKDADWTAGAGEQGADVIYEANLGFGLKYKIALQIKQHWGVENDTTGLDQLVRAFNERPEKVDAGVLVTPAENLGSEFQKKYEMLKNSYNIQVIYGNELFERLLNLISNPTVDFSF